MAIVPGFKLLACVALFISTAITAPVVKRAADTNSAAPATVHWTYEDFKQWGAVNAVCNNGKRQSPINIAKSSVVFDQKLADDQLAFANYEGTLKGTFLNNGHTVQFNIDSSVAGKDRPQIKGGGLGQQPFILEQFHFHWGNASQGKAACQGAEHTIDERSAPVEVHFVHFNAKYGKIEEAIKHDDGFAVIGFLFEPVTDKNEVKNDYSSVISFISSISEAGKQASAQINFGDLIPSQARAKDSAVFYRYDGSLTTPPCLEIVTWTVFEYRIPILASTIDEFRKAYHESKNDHSDGHHQPEPEPIANNFRPPQPLGNRVVKSNKHPAAANGNARAANAIAIENLLVMIVLVLASLLM